jgi:hypothetical protein
MRPRDDRLGDRAPAADVPDDPCRRERLPVRARQDGRARLGVEAERRVLQGLGVDAALHVAELPHVVVLRRAAEVSEERVGHALQDPLQGDDALPWPCASMNVVTSGGWRHPPCSTRTLCPASFVCSRRADPLPSTKTPT